MISLISITGIKIKKFVETIDLFVQKKSIKRVEDTPANETQYRFLKM